MNFRNVSNWILVGGQDLIIDAYKKLRLLNQKTIIFTGKRCLKEKLFNGKTFQKNLENLKINYFVENDINKSIRILKYKKKNTLVLSISSPWIFDKEFIRNFNYRIINLHEADLPQNRGGATITWLILMNLKKNSSVLHSVTDKIDGGDILLKKDFSLKNQTDPDKIFKINYENSRKLVNKFILDVINLKNFKKIRQNVNKSSYWPRLNSKKNSFIDWKWNLRDIFIFIKSFGYPFGGARTFLNNKLVIISDVKFKKSNNKFHPFQNGIIFKKNNKSLFVAHNDGTLIINEIRNNLGDDIKKKIRLGERLNTPQKHIELSLSYRPIYTSKGLKN